MIIDGRSVPDGTVVETDVCIVGGGTAGLVLAHEFVGDTFRLCVVESGGLKPDRDTHLLYWGENIGHPYYTLDTARARYLGGSSNRWHVPVGNEDLTARMRPLDPIDFEERDWVQYSGWPFNKAHLDPFYERAEQLCNIGSLSYNSKFWDKSDQPFRFPFIGNRVESIVFKFGSRKPFIEECAQDVSNAENITTLLYSNVVEIELDVDARTVTRLRVACLNGKHFWLSARLYVLAAGGLETPRLLLSSDARQSKGVGNEQDLVGRYFMEHLHFWSGMYVPSRSDLFDLADAYSEIRRVNNVPVIQKLALSEEVLCSEKLLSHCVQLIPRTVMSTSLDVYVTSEILSKSMCETGRGDEEITRRSLKKSFHDGVMSMLNNSGALITDICRLLETKLKKYMNKKRMNLYVFANMTEQIPNPNSRVKLSNERDHLGMRRIQLDWQITSQDVLSALRTQEIIAEDLNRSGLGCLHIQMKGDSPPQGLHGGYHHMGTTRMHHDPRRGVVDENSQVHGISNLFVAGPSVFPTGGFANPVLTIVALTLRLADHIKHITV